MTSYRSIVCSSVLSKHHHKFLRSRLLSVVVLSVVIRSAVESAAEEWTWLVFCCGHILQGHLP